MGLNRLNNTEQNTLIKNCTQLFAKIEAVDKPSLRRYIASGGSINAKRMRGFKEIDRFSYFKNSNFSFAASEKGNEFWRWLERQVDVSSENTIGTNMKYAEHQKNSELKIGDVVEIVRAFHTEDEDFEWWNTWEPEMDAFVGTSQKISMLTEIGICFEGLDHIYPSFCLEEFDFVKAEERAKVRKEAQEAAEKLAEIALEVEARVKLIASKPVLIKSMKALKIRISTLSKVREKPPVMVATVAYLKEEMLRRTEDLARIEELSSGKG